MTKTSDFGRILLHELRSRKERAPATNPMVTDACAYSNTAYKSSREPKKLKPPTGSFRAGNTQNRPNGGRKSVTVETISNQIVPSGRSQKLEKDGDLSMTLAFELKNGGKLGRNSSSNGPMFTFLRNIGRKQMERRNGELLNISHLHIEEISRGVQKLNQILRDCSNGLKFDRFSIEIGGELLKGAMDLEESLRMLVNPQDASEYSKKKPRKSRITLLEEDGDDNDESPVETADDIQAVARTDLTNFKHGKEVLAASISYPRNRSVGNGPEIKALIAVSEQHHSSSFQTKQVRIPNVVAKLMGLDELPGKVDSKVIEKESGKQPGKVLTNGNGRTRVVVHDKLSPQKDLKDKKSTMSSRKTTIKMDRQQSDIVQLNHNYGSRKAIQDKERKQKIAERCEIKEIVCDDAMQRMIPCVHKRSEAAVALQEKAKFGDNMHDGENRCSNKLLVGGQLELHSNRGLGQVNALRKSELQGKRRQSEERKQQSSKHKLQGKQAGNEPKCGNSSKTMSSATATNLQKKQAQMKQEATSTKGSTDHIDATRDDRGRRNQAGDRSSTNINNNRNSRQSRRDQESESAKARILFAVDEKPVQVQTKMKARSTEGNKLEVPRTNEAMTKKGASVYNLSRTSMHQGSVLQERKQTRLETLAISRDRDQKKARMFEEVKPKIIRSNKSIASLQSSNVAQEMQKATKQDSMFRNLDGCKNLNEPQALVLKDSGQISVPMFANGQKDQEPDFGRAEESKFKNIASDPLQGSKEANTYERPQNQPLTESENDFKHLLMNTREALFKLDIPNEQERKLILDCGDEVIERKGRRWELSAPPFQKVSILTSSKEKSLDNLVKTICKDFDKLKSYGREGDEDCPIQDYLPKMVEADVNDKEPDLNCMWDSGWNCMMFASLEKDDVIRDIEKYVLNGLLVGITIDLFTATSVSA